MIDCEEAPPHLVQGLHALVKQLMPTLALGAIEHAFTKRQIALLRVRLRFGGTQRGG